MGPLVLQLFAAFAPIVGDVIKHYQQTHDGRFPTPEETVAEFAANIDKFLREGSNWKAANPKP